MTYEVIDYDKFHRFVDEIDIQKTGRVYNVSITLSDGEFIEQDGEFGELDFVDYGIKLIQNV